MSGYVGPYRTVGKWELLFSVPPRRRFRAKAHIWMGMSKTRCGRDLTKGGYVDLHVSIARAMGLDDCSRCFPGSGR